MKDKKRYRSYSMRIWLTPSEHEQLCRLSADAGFRYTSDFVRQTLFGREAAIDGRTMRRMSGTGDKVAIELQDPKDSEVEGGE
jgi:hypothetical protein